MERPTHLGLRHLALNVQRLDEMTRFYVDLLGFSVEWEPDPDNVYLSSGTDNLALHRSTAPAMGRAATSTDSGGADVSRVSSDLDRAREVALPAVLDHLGLIVRKAEDVDGWAAFLESRGVTMIAKPRTHRDGARSCYFHDPDGNSVQIIHHPPISGKA
jgi:catechol 2,3-dioxygenase-like lactoylglutathione lyase family enzyme